MSFSRIILRSLRRGTTTTTAPILTSNHLHFHSRQQVLTNLIHDRSYAFSSAEEAAAERRRRKRRLRIEPPLNALRRDPNAPRPRPDPNAPRLPDSTSALVGPRLNLHNRVQSLIRADDLDAASATARHAVFSNTRPAVFTCNAIIAAMYRAKRFDDAIALFQFFFKQSNIVPNVVSYNFLIVTHCDAGRVDVGLEVYQHIIANAPFSPSSVTYRHLTKGLVDSGRIHEAVNLIREMLNKGHGADSLVFNNVIAGFLELENLEKADELFDELKERCLVYDGVVNATYMDWFFKRGRDKEAMESYRSWLDKKFNLVPATCNVLIETLLRHGRKAEAWGLFENMLDNHKPPNIQGVNSDTFNIMVNECFRLGEIDQAMATFKKVGTKAGSKPFAMDVAGYSNIIARCCENGMIFEAETLFDEVCSKSLNPDVLTHRNLIDAYLKADRINDAVNLLLRMADSGLRVIPSFSNRVLEVFVRHGKATECAQILHKLAEKDPKPDAVSYKIVVEALCHEGKLEVARDLLDEMMRFSVGVPPQLREFAIDIFRNAGVGDIIQKVLDTNRMGYPTQYSRPMPKNTDTSPLFRKTPPPLVRPTTQRATAPPFSESTPQESQAPQFSGPGPQSMQEPQYPTPEQVSAPLLSGQGSQQTHAPQFSGLGPQQMQAPEYSTPQQDMSPQYDRRGFPQSTASQYSRAAQFSGPGPQLMYGSQYSAPQQNASSKFDGQEVPQSTSPQYSGPANHHMYAPQFSRPEEQQMTAPQVSGQMPQKMTDSPPAAEPPFLTNYTIGQRS